MKIAGDIGLLRAVLCISALVFATYTESAAQTFVTVFDHDGNALVNSHVSYTGLQTGKTGLAITGIDGRAELPATFMQGDSTVAITVRYIGYAIRRDSLKRGSELRISLAREESTLNQVVVTAQYAANSPEKSVQKIRIIDRQQLEARAVVNLQDALKFETGIRLSQDNILGSSASVQGISGENLKIMIDGVPVIGRQAGNIDLSQINMNNVERIEIVEGPLSVNYGSNALAGTVNIITRKDQAMKYNSGFNTYYESTGQYNADGSLGYKSVNHAVNARAGRNYFDGWSEDEDFSAVPESSPADSNRVSDWKPKEQHFADASYTFTRKSLSLRIFGDYFTETVTNRGMPRAPYMVRAFDEYYHSNRYSAGLDAGGKWSGRKSWSFLAAFNHYSRSKNTYVKDLTTLEEVPGDASLQDTMKINNAMSRSALRISQGKTGVAWEAGYDINHEIATGKRIENREQEIGDYAIYSTAEIASVKGLIIKPGLRAAYNTRYKAPLIPSVSLRYAPSAATWRMSYAMGFRAPSLKELYMNFTDINHDISGNENLNAERSHNVQLDLAYKYSMAQSITVAEAGVFYNDISDMIALASIGSSASYTYINIGRYRTVGFDLEASQMVNHWKLTAGLLYTGRSEFTMDGSTACDFYFSPEVRSAVTYEFKKLGGNLATFYKYNGRIPAFSVDDAGESAIRMTEAYQILDLMATKYFCKKKLNWTLGVKNILDVKDVRASGNGGGIHGTSSGSVPVAWGRSLFTSLKFNFAWN